MAIEDAINRLAEAVLRNQQGAAVAEIIRQRDAWQKQAEQWKRDADFYLAGRSEHYKSAEHHRKVAASLRGVITRMKKARQA